MKLSSLTSSRLIFPGLSAADGSEVLRETARRVAEQGIVADEEVLFRKLLEREELGSTGIGSGVAIPHCKMPGLEEVVLAIAILQKPIDFGAVDRQPVRLFFLVVSPSQSPAAHLQCLAAISKWVKEKHRVEALEHMQSAEEIYALLDEEL